jgi:putative transposase
VSENRGPSPVFSEHLLHKRSIFPAGGEDVNQHLAPEIDAALERGWEPVYRSRLHYAITWSTRGRKPVLRAKHVRSLQQLIESTCEERGFGLVDVTVATDHVHLLLALRPSHSVASVVRELKGRTGMALITEHPELRVWLRGNLVWDERYAVETVSAARVEHVRTRLRALHSHDDDLAAAS